MIVINTIDDNKFSINGGVYLKNFMSHVSGDKLSIINVYDTRFVLLPWTNYDQFTINGSGYASALEVQAAIVDVLFTRNTGGGVSAEDLYDDGLIKGSFEAVPGAGYTFNFIAEKYKINGTVYTTVLNETIALSAADPDDDRIDLVIIELVGGVPTISVIEGVPGDPAAKPVLVDSDTQIEFTFITVAAGTATPPDITNTLIYNEFAQEVGGEFDCTTTSDDIFPLDESDPFNGTKDIYFNNTPSGDFIKFNYSALIDTINKNLIIKFKQILLQNYRFRLLLKNNTTNEQFGINIQGNSYGLDPNNLDYQSLIVPLSHFGLNQFDELRIINRRAGAVFLMDYIYMQEGASAGTSYVSPLIAKGDLLTHDGNSEKRLPVGADGTVPVADSTVPEGIKWAAPGGGGDMLKNENLAGLENYGTARTNLDVYSKSEVDSKVVGLYDHKGSYNASTNTPDLDSSPSGILKGDAYTVSVAGTFFTEDLEVGDVIIADQDNPTLLSHWTRLQKNLDAATIKTLYESNADTNAFTDALLAKLNDLKTQAITGTRVTASVSGTYAINLNNGDVFLLTMTADTTFSFSNLPTGTNTKTFEVLLTGAFTPTFPAYAVATPSSDDYDGAVRNRYIFDVINGTASSEDIITTIENLAS